MNEPRTIRAVIVDDEPLARQRIEDLLEDQESVEIVGTAGNGLEAVELIHRAGPDLVFLDVQMPGKTGLEVVEAIGPEKMPMTIFTTAFDQFALKAFELAAVDYLVKPFDDDRFLQALRRAQRALGLEEMGKMTRRLVSLLQQMEGEGKESPSAVSSPKTEYLERISVETRGQVRVVPVSRVEYITASGPYAELHVDGRTFAVRERMQTLEERLDPAVFMRIHRSAIVRLDRIDSLLRGSGGDYAVRLKDGTELSLSRARREELERKMGIR